MTSSPMRSSPWAYVALAAITAAFLLGIFVLIPDDEPQMRTALLGVVLLAAHGAIGRWLSKDVKKVDQKVNGRMSQMIEALQQAQRENAELRAQLVSRETSRRPGKKRS